MEITREEIAAAKQRLRSIVRSENRELEIARIINETFDPEVGVGDIIGKILNTTTAAPFEEVNYFLPTNITKTVLTLSANCDVTHTAVSPTSKQTLTFTDICTQDYYICLKDLLNGDHNVLNLYGDEINEEFNRYEIYAMLVLMSAAATAQSQLFTLDSGVSTFTFPKLYEMKKAIRKYGTKFYLITGTNVTEDVDLMDYTADKNRETNVNSIITEHIPIESLDVTVNGSAKDVIGDDEAYLIAVSDVKKQRPGWIVRRKFDNAGVVEMPDTVKVSKERLVMRTGNNKSVDTVDKFAKGLAGYEELGMVISNPYTVAKFTRE